MRIVIIGAGNVATHLAKALDANHDVVQVYSHTIQNAEIVMSTITTWGNKLCMIITAIGTGLVVSILPHITSSYILKDMKTVGKYINQSFEVLLYLSIPMTFGLSFLAKPVWEVFYGNHGFAAEVFSAYLLQPSMT